MKKLFVTLGLVVGLLVMQVSDVFAAEKIAIVSLQKALNSVNDGKKAKDSLRKEYEAKKKQIDNMKENLKDMSEDLEKQRMVLSPDALEKKRKDIQTKYLDLQNKAIAYERELKTKEAESAQKILEALQGIVLKISKEEGYTLVIENTNDTVLYSSNGQDITEKVIAAYNKK